MKVILNDDKIVLYLNKFMTEGLDFKNINGLEKYFRDLFIKLREIYNIKLNGFYYVYVYVDEFYGVILELEHENIEFFDYDENDIDMHIVLEKTSFLYELEDIFDYYELLKSIDIYVYKNKYYGKIKEEISDSLYMNLVEMSNIIYKRCNDIIKYGKKIET